MRRAFVLGVSVLACTPPPAAPSPGPTPGPRGPVTVRPLAFADDAKRGDAALILGTDPRGGSTAVPLVTGAGQVTVDSLYVITGGATATGGVGPVELTAATSTSGQVKVGIFEDLSGGLGPSWRAGVWTASLVTADVLGKDLTDLTFTASASGRVDGASASGLMTAGYLAALLGHPVAADATMTGTINPDGTIGPVAGIPQKFEAAIAAGKKRLGYPLGLRQAIDANSGQEVDLVELAAARGAVAVEVADVFAAVELLTGKTLPRPVPVEVEAMAPPPSVLAALDRQYEHWHALIVPTWPQVLTLASSAAAPGVISGFARQAIADYELAERLRAEGNGAAALRLLNRAWFAAATATSSAEILALAVAPDLDGALARLTQAEELATSTDQALAALGEQKPDTMGGHLQLMSAFRLAITGWAFRSMASTEHLPKARAAITALAALPAAERKLASAAHRAAPDVVTAVGAVARAVVGLGRAASTLEVEAATTLDYRCSLPNVRRLATSFRAAAASNLAYLDALFVAELAKAQRVPVDQAKVMFAAREPGYLVALIGANVTTMDGLPSALKTAWGEDSIAWALFTLTAGELSFGETSSLITEYYSLQTELGLDGRVVSVAHPAALDNMLAWAERRTREYARAAQVATGSVPVQTQLYYQIAAQQQTGDLPDKLSALSTYWTAMQFAQTAVMLARN